jgi:hypothetical protein
MRSREAILLWAVEWRILRQANAQARAFSLACCVKSPFVPSLRFMKNARGEISLKTSERSSSACSSSAQIPSPWARSTEVTMSEWT